MADSRVGEDRLGGVGQDEPPLFEHQGVVGGRGPFAAFLPTGRKRRQERNPDWAGR